MVHPLQCSFSHNLINIEDYSSGSDNNSISIWILHLPKQQCARVLVVLLRLCVLVGGIDERQMSSTAGKKGIQEHWFTKRVKR